MKLVNDIQAWFNSLSSRERRLVLVLGAAAAGFALFIAVFSFTSSAAATKRRTIEKLDKLADAQALAGTFREAEALRQASEQRLLGNPVSLISVLPDKGSKAGLDIQTMIPKGDVPIGDGKIVESAVELTLTDVKIRQLHEFLASLETGPGVVKVKFLRIEPKPAQETVTAWITVATYKLKQ